MVMAFLEGVFAFVAFGTIGFYLLAGAAFCWVWWFVRDDRGWPTLASIVVSGLILSFASQLPLIEWFSANWWTGVQWFFKYLALGILYAIPVRWLFHIVRSRFKVSELERLWRADQGIAETTDSGAAVVLSADQRYEFLKHLKQTGYNPSVEREYVYDPVKDGVRPTYDQNKMVIGMWLAYWPWSLVNWVFGDLIKHFYDLVRAATQRLADWMSVAVFGDKANLALTHDEREAIERREREEEIERQKLEEEEREKSQNRNRR